MSSFLETNYPDLGADAVDKRGKYPLREAPDDTVLQLVSLDQAGNPGDFELDRMVGGGL